MRVLPLDSLRAPDPRALALALAPAGGLAWLDGVGYGRSGWSFLGAAPVEVVRCPHDAGKPAWRDAWSALERGSDADLHALPEGMPTPPRFVGYIAYDAGFTLHPSLRPRHQRGDGALDLCFARYDAFVALDHTSGRAFLLGDDQAAAERLRKRLELRPGPPAALRPGAASITPAIVPEDALHARVVSASLDHIAAGDFYQVNLARRWAAKYSGDPLALFLAMREASPVPLGVYFDAEDHHVLARTMETFLRWDREARRIETRPIKGTVPRPAGQDAAAAATLRANPKELAEHTMIVDLMRNDLARVAEVGSVRVVDPFAVEPYAKLSHLVSTVEATTREGLGLAELMAATFPPGSVTGAPKLAAMQAIEDFEPEPRGVYCGAIGHIDAGGGLHLAVAIRTARFRGGLVEYFAGGGLVADSVAEQEVAETWLKARVFLDALERLRAEAD